MKFFREVITLTKFVHCVEMKNFDQKNNWYVAFGVIPSVEISRSHPSDKNKDQELGLACGMLTKQQLDMQVWRAVWTRDRNGGVIIKHLTVVVNSLMVRIA